jgi:hypothetical protein
MDGARGILRHLPFLLQRVRAIEAQAARGVVEAALDQAADGRGPAWWPWSKGLSLWVDALIQIEEDQRREPQEEEEP